MSEVVFVASLLAMLISCITVVSSTVIIVNEKLFSFTFLDFLLIPGWGKSDPSKEEETVGESPTIDQNETPLSTWTFEPPYPEYCKDGARIACLGESGQRRQSCTGTYKKLCVSAGGAWK